MQTYQANAKCMVCVEFSTFREVQMTVTVLYERKVTWEGGLTSLTLVGAQVILLGALHQLLLLPSNQGFPLPALPSQGREKRQEEERYEEAEAFIRHSAPAVGFTSWHGLSVARTWAFSDGGSNALQNSPGAYSEQIFQVPIPPAFLLCSFVFGENIGSDDEFFTNPVVKEMAAYLKSIDNKHLLEAGLEGFYGESSPQKQSYPGFQKPLLVTEFGKSCKDPSFSNDERDAMFRTVYSKVYLSARTGGATAGSLFWQLLAQGMDSYRDGYEVILGESPSTTRVITLQSHKLGTIAKLKRAKAMKGKH
ncbi:hypothetical protein GW17_00053699 [Ensete ventricosum]|nr:hypothetical protein GW17_00053699 [Ensete ventricosum]